MYNPEKIEKYAEAVFDRLNYFNDYTLKTIARRIKAVGQLSAADQQALKNISDITGDMKAITKKLADITRMNVADVEKMYTETVTDGVNTYKPLYDLKNLPFVPFEQNEYAQQLVRNWAMQTAGEMINLSRTSALGFDKYDAFGNIIGHTPLEGAFEKAISAAVAAVSSSTTDFNTAMSKTVEELGGSSVKVTYGSGINRSLSAMVRQNILYGAKQSAQAYDDYISAELALDGAEIDAHPGCRPTHLIMQGGIYALSDKTVTVDGVEYKGLYEDIGCEDMKETGTVQGLLEDYGCLHFKTGFMLGVSEPRYSQEELEQIRRESTELLEYDGKKKTLFEWKQTQRRLERAAREKQTQADMFREAGNIPKAREKEKAVAAYRAKYDDMCEKLGLTPKLERMRTYKGSLNKMVDKGGKSGIIGNVKNKSGVTDVHYIGKIDREIYKCVTKDIRTDEVIITDERIQHIKERHPNDYEKYFNYISSVISHPDYIIETDKHSTAVLLKEIADADSNEKFKLILRIAVKNDPKEYKNSVISFWHIGDTTWRKTLKNKKILYKSE